MIGNLSLFEPFVEEHQLTSCLAAVAARKGLPNVFIGLLVNGQQLFAATNDELRSRTSEVTRCHVVSAGCLRGTRPTHFRLIPVTVFRSRSTTALAQRPSIIVNENSGVHAQISCSLSSADS